MNRLIKAEWFRARKSSGIMKWLFIICILTLLVPFLDDLSGVTITASNYFIAFEQQTCIFIPIFMSAITAAFAGLPFNNKTALYEVMAGNKISHILNSKIIVIAPLVAIVYTSLFAITETIFGVSNGIGELKQLPLRIVLLFVIVLHITLVSVLAVTSVRHYAGIAVAFLRFEMLDAIFAAFIDLFFEEKGVDVYVKASNWICSNQIFSIGAETISGFFIAQVILSLVIEAVIWYVVSYIGYRKKLFA